MIFLAKNSLTDQAIDKPSKVEVPRPISSNKSYGIEAARLAGVPTEVVNNAKGILNSLEKNNSNTIHETKSIESCK